MNDKSCLLLSYEYSSLETCEGYNDPALILSPPELARHRILTFCRGNICCPYSCILTSWIFTRMRKYFFREQVQKYFICFSAEGKISFCHNRNLWWTILRQFLWMNWYKFRQLGATGTQAFTNYWRYETFLDESCCFRFTTDTVRSWLAVS